MSLIRTPPVWADLERVGKKADEIKIGQALLTAVAAVLYAVGWVTGKVFTIASLAVRWFVAAVVLGWRDSRVSHGFARQD